MNTWLYLSNTFAVVTKGNLKLMDIILRDHVARLIKCLAKAPSDTDLQAMYGRAASALSLWGGTYIPYRVAKGVYKSRTQIFYELLATASTRLDEWQIDIQAAGGPTRPFMEGKPLWTALFPQGREPFLTSAVDQRVAAFTALGQAMVPHAALATVRDSVQEYASELNAARQQQQGEEGGTETDSETVETERLAAAEAMYKNLGRAMEKYGSKNNMVAKFFDLSYIRDGGVSPPEGSPSAPGNFTVAPGTESTTVTAAWSPVNGADGYRLYRRLPTEQTSVQVGADIPAGSSAFTIDLTGQPTGVELEFTVAAYNAAGEGPKSAPETITL